MPRIPAGARPSWYALPLRYEPAELGGLSVDRFLEALHAEGATAADLPGSTRPLSDHPLFRTPGELLPGCADRPRPAVGSFPTAEHVHGSTLKLPVWHRDQDFRLADAYTAAVAKVARHHEDIV
ncbi:hypothetical protein ACFW9F_21230 [Streptomyces sp. NPDC059506]|uniref:hypothetical protein n=1 Tax=Streptomyces sp. NPDC059506 TaxID=3347751 RepID=UPI0036A66CCE